MVFTGVGYAFADSDERGTVATPGSGRNARLSCPGGMVRLGQPFSEAASVFPEDPAPQIDVIADYASAGFLLEQVTTGTHTGTHLSAPAHFIAGAPTVDDLPAEDFAWPAYVIDVRSRTATTPKFQITKDDIRAYEKANGQIPKGALVILFTGFGDKFATPAYFNPAPGFSADAVNWLFSNRRIKGVGSDTFGPDASDDTDFAASTAVYSNGGITIENMRRLDQLHVRGDILIAPTTQLLDGSGFQTDPLGCRGGANGRGED